MVAWRQSDQAMGMEEGTLVVEVRLFWHKLFLLYPSSTIVNQRGWERHGTPRLLYNSLRNTRERTHL